MFLQYGVSILLVCSTFAYGMITFGTCPTKTPVASFDLRRFSGLWYENRALEGIHLTQEAWGTCQSILFDFTSLQNVTTANTNIFDFLPSTTSTQQQNYRRETTTLSTLVLGRNYTGVINADFPNTTPDVGQFRVHGTWRFLSVPVQSMTILDTDYTQYAILWSCQNMGVLNKQTAWVLTRSRNLTASESSSILTSLFTQGLPAESFRVTEQSNCESNNRRPFFSPLVLGQVKNTLEDEVAIED